MSAHLKDLNTIKWEQRYKFIQGLLTLWACYLEALKRIILKFKLCLNILLTLK